MNSDLQAKGILDQAEILIPAEQVQTAVANIACKLNAALTGTCPLVLSVMGGAVVFTGQLLPQLTFPLDFDYIHVSRYGNSQEGGSLNWKVEPRENVSGRIVLVLDDLLDEGETLAAIRQRVMALGASRLYSAVFAVKQMKKTRPVHADFFGVELPCRFVFGFGMDIQGKWRNLPAVYALREKQAQTHIINK